MMQFTPGNVVRSTAGRDKGRLYIVVAVAANRIMVADGQKRTLAAPKPKNPLHLQYIGGTCQSDTDDRIRQLLTQGWPAEERGGK